MQGTDEANPTSCRDQPPDCYRAFNCQRRENSPFEAPSRQSGILRLAQGQGASSTDASGMRECPDLNDSAKVVLGRATNRPPGLLPRKSLATNSVVRNQMSHVGNHRLAWDFETLEHYGIGFEQSRNRATMIPRSNTPSMGRIGGTLSRAPTSI